MNVEIIQNVQHFLVKSEISLKKIVLEQSQIRLQVANTVLKLELNVLRQKVDGFLSRSRSVFHGVEAVLVAESLLHLRRSHADVERRNNHLESITYYSFATFLLICVGAQFEFLLTIQ